MKPRKERKVKHKNISKLKKKLWTIFSLWRRMKHCLEEKITRYSKEIKEMEKITGQQALQDLNKGGI